MEGTCKQQYNCKVFKFSTFFAVVSLVMRITASYKEKYLLNHAFQPFFQFFPVSSTSSGRNLFLPGRFKPGFNPVSSTRWKKPANPGRDSITLFNSLTKTASDELWSIFIVTKPFQINVTLYLILVCPRSVFMDGRWRWDAVRVWYIMEFIITLKIWMKQDRDIGIAKSKHKTSD